MLWEQHTSQVKHMTTIYYLSHDHSILTPINTTTTLSPPRLQRHPPRCQALGGSFQACGMAVPWLDLAQSIEALRAPRRRGCIRTRRGYGHPRRHRLLRQGMAPLPTRTSSRAIYMHPKIHPFGVPRPPPRRVLRGSVSRTDWAEWERCSM